MKRKWAAAAIACAAVSMSVPAHAAPTTMTEMELEVPAEDAEGAPEVDEVTDAELTDEETQEISEESGETDNSENAQDGETADEETADTDISDTEQSAVVQSATAQGSPAQQVIDSRKYMVYPDGTHYTGWLQMTESWKLYFDPAQDGAAATGLCEIEGKHYLFDGNGILYTKAGTPVIDGKKYWMNTDGSLNSGWLQLGKWRLYFDPETYEARTGLSEVEGKRYLFDGNGSLYAESGTPVVDGHKYWFGSDGSLNTGWLHLANWVLYFDEETCQGATGVTEIDGKNYVFDKSGILLTGRGTPVINGKKYYFNADGSIQTGWVTLGSWTFYFDPETGAAATGVVIIDGERCFFDKNGVLMSQGLTETQERACRVLDQVGWNLRAAYNWAAGLTYRTPSGAPGGTERVDWYADYGFTTGTGNCYVMASTFYQMAKLLGYDVYYVEGSVPLAAGGFGPHGWCEIVINGATYVFDPNFTNETGRNGYQITYGTSGTWRYMNYHRVV